jgi:peroxiredoxin
MNTSNRVIIFGAVILLTAFVLNWFSAEPAQQAPQLAFTDVDGKQHQVNYSDQPVLMIFWATDCPGCVKEMPELVELYHNYADKGLNMVGVAMAHDTPEHIKAMRTEKQLPYTLTWDKDNSIAQSFNNVRVTPTHFLVDTQGNIVMRKIGELNFHQLEAKLNELGLPANKI